MSVQSPALPAYRSTAHYQSRPLERPPAAAFSTAPCLGTQLTATARMRFGFQPLGTVFFLQLLSPMHRGGGGFDQTSHFVDALTFVKQPNRPLAAIF